MDKNGLKMHKLGNNNIVVAECIYVDQTGQKKKRV